MDVAGQGTIEIAVNTCSLLNRDSGFDSRVRVGRIESEWRALPRSVLEEHGDFDYADVERGAKCFLRALRPDRSRDASHRLLAQLAAARGLGCSVSSAGKTGDPSNPLPPGELRGVDGCNRARRCSAISSSPIALGHALAEVLRPAVITLRKRLPFLPLAADAVCGILLRGCLLPFPSLAWLAVAAISVGLFLLLKRGPFFHLFVVSAFACLSLWSMRESPAARMADVIEPGLPRRQASWPASPGSSRASDIVSSCGRVRCDGERSENPRGASSPCQRAGRCSCLRG